ncbi:MAG: hypothetical protein R3A10_04115 [Caldilineaceae bacterium]
MPHQPNGTLGRNRARPVQQIGGMFAQMARISIQPEWVGTLDFEQRFPGAIEAAMQG